MKVLSYGRNRWVIVEAPRHDPNCVLANVLAAHFLSSSSANASPAASLLQAANAHLENATSYEKAVFYALTYLLSPNRDDDVAIQQHSKVCFYFLVSVVFIR